MYKKEELIPIGIASSVAASYGYDWNKCIEIAKYLDISIVQLYLSQFEPKFNWQTIQSSRQQIYMHLPCKFNHAHPIINLITRFSTIPILIQHERYLHQRDIKFFKKQQLPLGFENDKDTNLGGYLKSLIDLSNTGLKLTAIIDFPRFYHQFNTKYSEEKIYKQVVDILKWCKKNHIPVIIHAIDIANYNPDHCNWVPIFKGILPWERILTFIIKKSIPVKSVVFEYEDLINTEKSVYSLREWFSIFK